MADKPPAKGQEEPSIEEILGSIRRIIAEDDEPAAVDPMDEEPLELTNKIEPDGTIVNAGPEPVALREPEPVAAPVSEKVSAADLDAMFDTPAPAPKPAPAPVEDTKLAFEDPVKTPPVEEKPMAQDDILSNSTADAATAAMAKLARHTPIAEEGHDGVTVENIVREMLKPMLKEWLDKNLPDLVQKMVERELEKLSKRV